MSHSISQMTNGEQLKRNSLFKCLIASILLCGLVGTANAVPISVFNTGTDGAGNVVANGTGDIHYTISGPGAIGPNIRAANGAWIANDTVGSSGSAWLNGMTQANQVYTYQTTFDLTGFDLQTVVLSLLLAADNQINDVLINGGSTGIEVEFGFPAFQQLNGPFVIDSGFISGVNTLDFLALYTGGDAGFRAEILGTGELAPVPEPTTLALLAFALVGIGFRRRIH